MFTHSENTRELKFNMLQFSQDQQVQDINHVLAQGITVGPLLYMPGFQKNVPKKLINGQFDNLTSIAFCLEDSIVDTSLEKAELTLLNTLGEISRNLSSIKKLPKIFIRIRNPKHLLDAFHLFFKYSHIIQGYILPKFDMRNAEAYIDNLNKINNELDNNVLIMPTLESENIANITTRYKELENITQILQDVKHQVLNIRVGGNDFLRIFALRCPVNYSIYDIGVVKNILVDIINVFVKDYIVSGPVWNYIGTNKDEEWAIGLKKELAYDKINGFIGKTAIHPCQVDLILEGMKVDQSDYADALSILNWEDADLGVSRSKTSSRLNEVKCHLSWAYKTKILGDFYGVRGKV